ncbi:adenine nucleotide alpha hydrolases-like protein [Neoconidiobolus thromboides FSU 785]|nr:adenine nucleotide alpha hydrolases-like protein [Neoconidiobolus thromboides FSU 785]
MIKVEDKNKKINLKVNGVALSFNGGKDCTVILSLFLAVRNRYLKQKKAVPAFYINTPNPFKEIEEFVDKCEKQHNILLYRMNGPLKTGLGEFLEKHKEIKAVLIGTRKTDPFAEDLNFFNCTSEGWPKVMRIHPIIFWDYKMVWWFLRELNIPYCKLYDEGYTSLGDRNNTIKNPKLKNELTGEFDPAYKLLEDRHERDGRIKNVNK